MNSGHEHDEPSTLQSTYGIDHPLDRMALTANGNLQRLVASYYDAPVSVVVESCVLRDNDNNNNNDDDNNNQQVWDRVVHLQVFEQTFCTATSVICVHDPLCQRLVQTGEVGLGQLFRFLDLLPEFELHAAGPKPQGGFWRDYTLQCAELTCSIVEDFQPGMWDLKPKR